MSECEFSSVDRIYLVSIDYKSISESIGISCYLPMLVLGNLSSLFSFMYSKFVYQIDIVFTRIVLRKKG